jgi:hypothetical protein
MHSAVHSGVQRKSRLARRLMSVQRTTFPPGYQMADPLSIAGNPGSDPSEFERFLHNAQVETGNLAQSRAP